MITIEVNNKQVGSRIKNIRLNLGITAEEFGKKIAAEIGTDRAPSQSLVSRWERGVNLPNNERLKAISELGNMTINELLYGDPKKFIEKVLIDDINEQGKYYHQLIDYLSLHDNLYDEINAIENKNNNNSEVEKLRVKTMQNKAISYTRENLDDIIIHLRAYVNEDLFDEEFIIAGSTYYFEERTGISRTVEHFYRDLKDTIDTYDRAESNVDIDDVTKIMNFLMETSSYKKEEDAWTGAMENVFLSRMLKEAKKMLRKVEKIYEEYKYIYGED